MVDPFVRKIMAVGIGNILEWYDFVIFGLLADVIGRNFFPSNLTGGSLMTSLSVLTSAFLVRPIGGYMMGYLGDNYGRKKALEVSVLIMMVPSFLLGCIPNFSVIGYFGTALLCLLRLLQGLAVGGEMVGALIFTIEITDSGNRGLWGGAVKATGLFGTVLGMAHVSYLRHVLTEEQMVSWGWRIPFLTSLLIGVMGMYLRSNLQETDEYTNCKENQLTKAKSSLLEVIQFNWVEIILVCGVSAFWSVGYYTCFIWLGSYMSTFIGEGPAAFPAMDYAGELNIVMTLFLIFLMPLAGMLGDYLSYLYGDSDNGYRRILMIGCAITTVFGAPAFALINHRQLWSAAIGQMVFVISIAIYGGNLPALIVEQFTVKHRYSGLGIAYNLSNAIFAGTAPLVQSYLVVKSTELDNIQGISSLLPAVYLCLVSVISLCVLFWAPPIISKRRIELDKKLYHLEYTHKDKYNKSIIHFDHHITGFDHNVSLDESIDRSSTPMILQIKSGLDAKFTGTEVDDEDSADEEGGTQHINSSIHAGWLRCFASLCNFELTAPPPPKKKYNPRDVLALPAEGKKTFSSHSDDRQLSREVLQRRLNLSMNTIASSAEDSRGYV
jgi:MFS transporter, MHS family, proline/betaine transporter